MFYAEPIKHDNLTREFTSAAGRVVSLEIRDPRTVVAKSYFDVEGVAFRSYAKFTLLFDGTLKVSENSASRINNPGRQSQKQSHIDAVAKTLAESLVVETEEMALEMLNDEGYKAKAATASEFVRASLADKLRKLTETIGYIRKTVNDTTWFEVGSNSTGSIANLQVKAAREEAHFAAAVETFKYTVGAFAIVDLIVDELTAGLDYRINLYV